MSNVSEKMQPGDFTKLAVTYSKYRPKYSEAVLSAILGLYKKPISELDFVDVGAGTGIWTRMVAKRGLNSICAVEPNLAMRNEGVASNEKYNINWLAGSAEQISLENNSADLLSMASSFHWANFETAVKEFHRVLKPGGYFVALWNPRYLEKSPLLQEIESYITKLEPDIRRVSSGKSEHIDALSKRLVNNHLFKNTLYLEGTHVAKLTQQQYIGAWESVNDVRVQLGENKFSLFLDFVRSKVREESVIECYYQTRAWVIQKED